MNRYDKQALAIAIFVGVVCLAWLIAAVIVDLMG